MLYQLLWDKSIKHLFYYQSISSRLLLVGGRDSTFRDERYENIIYRTLEHILGGLLYQSILLLEEDGRKKNVQQQTSNVSQEIK